MQRAGLIAILATRSEELDGIITDRDLVQAISGRTDPSESVGTIVRPRAKTGNGPCANWRRRAPPIYH